MSNKDYKYRPLFFYKNYKEKLKEYDEILKKMDTNIIKSIISTQESREYESVSMEYINMLETLDVYRTLFMPSLEFNMPNKDWLECQIINFQYYYNTIDLIQYFDLSEIKNSFILSKKFDFDLDKSFDLLHDFFNCLDKDFLLKYEELYKIRKDVFFIRKNIIPEFLPSPHDNKYFISINNIDSLFDISNLSHEIAHYIGYKIIGNHAQFNRRGFQEIESTFIQIQSLQYFSKILNCEKEGIFEEISYLKLINADNNKIIERKILFEELQKLNIKNVSYKYIFDLAKEKLGLSFIETFNLLRINWEDILKYSIPYFITVELLDLYKQDKEKALYKLKKIISEDNEKRPITTTLEKNNIYLYEHVNEYTLSLKRKIN